MSQDMLQIAGGWITITTVRIAAWIIWLRRHSLRYVLSKAPASSALLKSRRIVVKYSHDGSINRREQLTLVSVGFLFPELPS
jgi:hypothetical protein